MAQILVVEDNRINLELLATILATSPHEVLLARSGAEGIELARRTLPGLIFMDIEMPGMDGMQATGLLKADPRTTHIPVIALTAFAMKGDEARFRAAGCDGYLAKPFDYEELLALVLNILG